MHWSLYVWQFDFGFCIRPCIYVCCVYSVLAFGFCGAYTTAFFLGYKIYHVSPELILSIVHSEHDFNPSMYSITTYPKHKRIVKSQSLSASPNVFPFLSLIYQRHFVCVPCPERYSFQQYMVHVSVTIHHLQWLESMLPLQAHKAIWV